jgi:hypothetical protein
MIRLLLYQVLRLGCDAPWREEVHLGERKAILND